MRTFLIRGAMITLFAVTGLFGSAATVQFDGLSADVQTYSVEAKVNRNESCTMTQDERPGQSPLGWHCPDRP